MKKLIKKHQAGNKISNSLTDTGTRLLHAVSSFGGSAIGDAVEGLSPRAADAVEKYSLGLIPHTSQAQLEANRSDNPNRLINRAGATASAVQNVALGELTGGAMKWGAGKIASGEVAQAGKQLVRKAQGTTQPNPDMEILNFWGKRNKTAPTVEPKVKAPVEEPAFSPTDRTKFSEKETAFIKDRDARYGTNYLDVLQAKTQGRKFNVIPQIDDTGYAYHGRNIDMDMFGKTSRMRIGHQPNIEYLKNPSEYNLDLGGITIEASPRKLSHEVSHGNDLMSDLFKKHNLASKIDEVGIKEWSNLGKEGFTSPEARNALMGNYATYGKAKTKLLLNPAKASNKFNEGLLQNKFSLNEYNINNIKEIYPNNLGNKNLTFDSDAFKAMSTKDYNYLTEPSEVKARLHDIKRSMVKQGVLEDETSQVTGDHIMKYEPIDDTHTSIIDLYKNKKDLLTDLSKVGVMGALPAVAGLRKK
jgi:hypothetical protein